MIGDFCVCGARVERNTGGYNCPRCYRSYNVKGKQINKDRIIRLTEVTKAYEIQKHLKKVLKPRLKCAYLLDPIVKQIEQGEVHEQDKD